MLFFEQACDLGGLISMHRCTLGSPFFKLLILLLQSTSIIVFQVLNNFSLLLPSPTPQKSEGTRVMISECSFCQQLHFWNRYQTCQRNQDSCGEVENVFEKFFDKTSNVTDFDQCLTELSECDPTDTRNRRSFDRLKESASVKFQKLIDF